MKQPPNHAEVVLHREGLTLTLKLQRRRERFSSASVPTRRPLFISARSCARRQVRCMRRQVHRRAKRSFCRNEEE
jgi:hypothetical protein